jgi:hypothetical protein
VESVTAVQISDLLLLVYALLLSVITQSQISVFVCGSLLTFCGGGRGFICHYSLYKPKFHFGITYGFYGKVNC